VHKFFVDKEERERLLRNWQIELLEDRGDFASNIGVLIGGVEPGVTNGAIGCDNRDVGDAGDGVVGIINFLFAEGDVPRHIVLGHEFGHEGHFLFGIAFGVDACVAQVGDESLQAGDADKGDGGIREVGNMFADIGEGANTRTAPRGPKIEDDDLSAEVGEGLHAVAGGPSEMQLRSGPINEGRLFQAAFLHALDRSYELVGFAGGLGVGEVELQLGQLRAGQIGVFEKLKREERLLEGDVGDGIGIVPSILREEGVVGPGFLGKVGRGFEPGLQFGRQARIHIFDIGGRGVGCWRIGGGSGGEGAGDEGHADQDEEEAKLHEEYGEPFAAGDNPN